MKIRIVASVCAGLALVSSVVAVSSWLELRKQRDVNAALALRQIEVPPLANLAAAPPDTTVTAARLPDKPIGRTGSSMSSSQPDKWIPTPRSTKELLKDPNFRKLWRGQVLELMEVKYPALGQQLGLSRQP
jgi:hypothetical protein